MTGKRFMCAAAIAVIASSCRDQEPGVATAGAASDTVLPSWKDGTTRRSIIEFVDSVTRRGSPDFVPPAERIAVFDNDGTLWTEQPMYVQLAFAIDRVKELAPQYPEWKDEQPFKGILEGDPEAVLESGEPGLMKLIAATHVGNTTEEFERIVARWIDTARHPQRKRLYTELVYQPMLEMLAYLRAHGFKTYIVSGGGVEFMRPWSERVYRIPPEQVIGSRTVVTYEIRGDRPVLMRHAKVDLVDDKAGKPVGIHQMIGRRPIIAFGNSDGDFQMLEWTTSAQGRQLGVLVHHTDAKREVAYDRSSHIGKLDRALEAAPARGWVVVDMKRDWSVIFPPPKASERAGS